MNLVDIIIIIIFASSIIIGFGRGFVKEIISTLSLIAALIIAITFASPLATTLTNSPFIQHLIGKSSSAMEASTSQPASYIAIGLSFFLLFIGVLIIGAIIGFILNSIFQFGILSIGNRIMGALFGFVRGFILAVIIIFVVQLTPLSNETWWSESRFVAISQPIITSIDNLISPVLTHLKSQMNQKLDNSVTTQEEQPETE